MDVGTEKPVEQVRGAETILKKLKTALRHDGDFPARAQAVIKVKTMANDPNSSVNKMAEIILTEVSLGTRVLHLVNSAYFHGAKRITTISEAIMRVGMTALTDLFAGFVLMRKFIPLAKRGGIFADNIKKSLITSLVAAHLASSRNDVNAAERAYLAGSFFNLGHLLLSYYFPQVYETAAKRATARKHHVGQSISEILGIHPVDLNLAVIETLDIPQYYCDVVAQAHKPLPARKEGFENDFLPEMLATASGLAEAIIYSQSKTELKQQLERLATECLYSVDELVKLAIAVQDEFSQHCHVIEMTFLTLPDYLRGFTGTDQDTQKEDEAARLKNERFHKYFIEMKQAVIDGEPMSSVIAAAMETVVAGLEFDRAVLLMASSDKRTLQGQMSFGKKLPRDAKTIELNVTSPRVAQLPAVRAYLDGYIQEGGAPLVDNGDFSIAIPIGAGMSSLGVLYADKIRGLSKDPFEISEHTRASLNSILQLFDLALTKN